MAHKKEFIATGGGYSVKNGSTITPVINQDGTLNGSAVIDNASITSAKISTDVIQVATVNLSAAQIIAMYTTPVTLVAGVTGKTIVIDDIVLKMTTTATQFTGGGALEIRYTNGSGAKVSADIAAAVVTATAGTSYTINKSVVTSLTGVAAAPVVLTNATQVFAAGTGTGVVTVRYHLV